MKIPLSGPLMLAKGEDESSVSKDIKQRVQEVINKHRVVVFSKDYCPYCDRAKGLFDKLKVEYAAAELDLINTGDQIQSELQKLTGQRTVPNIFINHQHIGGCDKVHELHRNGELAKLLAQAAL